MIKFSPIALLACLFSGTILEAQTVIWSDNFNNGCASNCLATTYNGWTVQDNIGGANGANPNIWYVSCAEEGVTPPGCGNSCIGDATLHIGADAGAGGDLGASYNETAAANATYRLAVSPVISTASYSGITLNFDFIAFGSSSCTDDRAQLWLSTDGGATWPAGFQYCLNTVCCGTCNGYSQGQWTTYSLTLPAAFNNNPNIRVGFHWVNNGNGSGTDPAVAIDDIRFTVPVVPLTLTSFSGKTENHHVKLNWTTETERNVGYYAIERSTDGKNFDIIGHVKAKGNQQPGTNNYEYTDGLINASKLYYRLKMVDMDASFTYSPIVSPAGKSAGSDGLIISTLIPDHNTLHYQVTAPGNLTVDLRIFDLQGKVVFSQSGKKLNKGNNDQTINITGLTAGVYLLHLVSPANNPEQINITQKFVITR